MQATQTRQADGFTGFLAAPGRSPEIPEGADVYGWLAVGNSKSFITKLSMCRRAHPGRGPL